MIGIDVGGANLKIVDDAGVHIHYCPLWEKSPLTESAPAVCPERSGPAAVVMSGELADCFENKLQGISFIVDAVRKAFPRARFYGTDAQFHDQCCSAACAQPTGLPPLIFSVPGTGCRPP